MMHKFLSVNRSELIERCRSKVAQRSTPKATADELEHGIPLFLDQLIKTLRVEQTTEPMTLKPCAFKKSAGLLSRRKSSEPDRISSD